MNLNKAIAVIRKITEPITDASQLEGIPNVGEKLRAKIDEFLTTGQYARLESQKTEKTRAQKLFERVHGIGTAMAIRLTEKGFLTIDDLRNNMVRERSCWGCTFSVRSPPWPGPTDADAEDWRAAV